MQSPVPKATAREGQGQPREASVRVLNHPLVIHKISLLRDKRVKPIQFRQLTLELSLLLASRATLSLDLIQTKKYESPISSYDGIKIKDKIAIFPIWRAGQEMVNGLLTMLPSARIYHLGLFRDQSTLLPVEYYNKLPAQCCVDLGYVLEPMIATAGTAIAAVNILKDWGLKRIKFLAIMASQKGIDALSEAHPDIDIYVCAIDKDLNEKGYITPGLGDAGDRLFKTTSK